MPKKKIAKRWFVEIYEEEKSIQVFRDGGELMRHVAGNDPMLVSTIELTPADAVIVAKHFKSKEVATVGVRWNKYCGDLGLDPT